MYGNKMRSDDKNYSSNYFHYDDDTYVECCRIVMITCRDNRLKLRIIISILVFDLTFDNNVYGFKAKKFSYSKQSNKKNISLRIFNCQCNTYQIDGSQLLCYEFGVQFNNR